MTWEDLLEKALLLQPETLNYYFLVKKKEGGGVAVRQRGIISSFLTCHERTIF